MLHILIAFLGNIRNPMSQDPNTTPAVIETPLMPGLQQLELGLAYRLWPLHHPQSHAIPQRGFNMTVGLMQTPQ